MRQDQNRIELQPRNGIYEELILRLANTGYCLPGSIVATTSDSQEHVTNVVDSQAMDLESFETLVVIENALIGKGINAKSYNGERILARRAVSGDVYLIRAVPDVYKIGEPVYAIQTPNGIYVSKEQDGKFIGWAMEDFEVTQWMVDLVDDSTPVRPSTINLNGAIVNLLRVRIGGKKRLRSTAPSARFSVTASGNPTNLLTITFTRFPELITPDLTADDIIVSGGLIKGTLAKINATTYTLAVTVPQGASVNQTITITRSEIHGNPVAVQITLPPPLPPPPPAPIGWFGVLYPEAGAAPGGGTLTAFAPFDASFLDRASTTEITGAKRNIDVTTSPTEEEWNAIQPAPPGAWSLWDDWGYRVFIVTRNWGSPQAWDITQTFNQTSGFTPVSVTIDGTEYSGLMSPTVGAITPVRFVFP